MTHSDDILTSDRGAGWPVRASSPAAWISKTTEVRHPEYDLLAAVETMSVHNTRQ